LASYKLRHYLVVRIAGLLSIGAPLQHGEGDYPFFTLTTMRFVFGCPVCLLLRAVVAVFLLFGMVLSPYSNHNSRLGGVAGRKRCDLPSFFLNSPLLLGGQVLRGVAGRAILPLLKFLAAGFGTHGIAGASRMQTRAPVYRDLHFPATHPAILDEIAIESH
jgi:hypothetical protein